MKQLFLIHTIAFLLFLTGCAGNTTQTETSTIETDVIHEESHHDAATKEVELDNGEKWQANLETNEGIDKMLTLVNEEKSKNSPDYEGLKGSLDTEFMIVLDKCTMTGESHDQLHNYLLPLKARIDKLQASSNEHSIEDINSYLLTYQNYFK